MTVTALVGTFLGIAAMDPFFVCMSFSGIKKGEITNESGMMHLISTRFLTL